MTVDATEGEMLEPEGHRRRRLIDFNLLDSTSFTEGMPRRLGVILDQPAQPSSYREEWGIGHDQTKEFPSTVDEVVEEAFAAVAGTLFGLQKMDPNIVGNAVARSIFAQRPVRKKRDSGRIGLEIDGVGHLFPELSRNSPAIGIRRIALLLAAKMSRKESWASYEIHQSGNDSPEFRPVVVCFNTIKQALVASRELKQLKLEHAEQIGRHISKNSPFDRITIQCIHDGIPMELQLDRSSRRRSSGLTKGYVNATKGLVLVVQPTDYNSEHKPPGPAIDAVGSFQRLVAQASIEEVPVVALTPRFLSSENPYGGWDQSGYQKSATYGGLEPPKGPTPWIMRDFSPPVFCWIGDALRLAVPKKDTTGDCGERCNFSRMSLVQSVMEQGHSWHVFAAKECTDKKLPTEYVFLCRTSSSSGRPTRAVLEKILEDCSCR